MKNTLLVIFNLFKEDALKKRKAAIDKNKILNIATRCPFAMNQGSFSWYSFFTCSNDFE